MKSLLLATRAGGAVNFFGARAAFSGFSPPVATVGERCSFAGPVPWLGWPGASAAISGSRLAFAATIAMLGPRDAAITISPF